MPTNHPLIAINDMDINQRWGAQFLTTPYMDRLYVKPCVKPCDGYHCVFIHGLLTI